MTAPYQAIGLVPTMWGIRRREEIAKNLDHLEHLVKAAFWLGGLDLPVRLVAIPEGALQGFTDEVMDTDHEQYARECAIDIPGPETERLGELARQWDIFIMAQAKARHEEFPGRYFNVGFVIDPQGEVILRHHKVVPLLPVEHSMTPHNVWDRWVELYGDDARRLLPRGRHRDRAAGDHDGQRGLVSRERARAGYERRRGRLPGLLPAPGERRVRAADTRAGARQQHVRGCAEPRHLSPHGRLGHARSTRSAATP